MPKTKEELKPEATAVEEPEGSEPAAEGLESPEVPAEGTPESSETPEEPEEPSAEELRQQLKDRDAELARLKGEKEAEKEPAPKPSEEPARVAVATFAEKTLPLARKLFVEASPISVSKDEEGEVKVSVNPEAMGRQFDVMKEFTDQFVVSVLSDHVYPHVRALMKSNIELKNELAILNLRASNPKFAPFEARVRKSLESMTPSDRDKKDAVQDIFLKLLGGASVSEAGKPPTPKKPDATGNQRRILQDISAGAGGGKPGKAATVTLTPAQEADRLEIETHGGPMPRELYAAKLKAMNDKLKAAGKKELLTLRG